MQRAATIDGMGVLRGDMKRRDFIKLVGGACAISAGSVARSQEAGRAPRIGILADDRILVDPNGAPIWRAFFEELAIGGFIEGTNLQVVRRGFGLTDLNTAANELVRARPDVVFALATPAAHALKLATRSIPLVAMADDLVGSSLVGSMAHPEANVTGVAIFAFQLDLKRLELLHEAVPNAARIGIIADPDQIRRPDALDRAARDLGIEIVLFTAKSNEEIIHAIEAMKAKSIDAVNVLASARLASVSRLILERLTSQKLPSIYQWPHGVEEGCLIAYGPRLDGIYRQCGRQVMRLLRGAKVADVPVEQPTELLLTINVKTAKALGVIIPPTLLIRADQVID
jgi:putative tryptophan/tyrosine transport system substrate-binding protein